MIPRLLALSLLLPVLAGVARAADTARGDEAMVRLCRGELEQRLFGGGAHGDAFVTAQEIQHQPDRTVIRLSLASGEGRTLAGSCIFRDGKLFDVK